VNDEVTRRERGLQIVQLAVVQLAKAIAEGGMRMMLSDVDKLIRLETFLRDEPESQHEIRVDDLSGKSDRKLQGNDK